MVVYPEIESWDEFYPSEIFVSYTETDNVDDIFKRVPVGAKLYMGMNAEDTQIFKKIGEYKNPDDMANNFVFLGIISVK